MTPAHADAPLMSIIILSSQSSAAPAYRLIILCHLFIKMPALSRGRPMFCHRACRSISRKASRSKCFEMKFDATARSILACRAIIAARRDFIAKPFVNLHDAAPARQYSSSCNGNVGQYHRRKTASLSANIVASMIIHSGRQHDSRVFNGEAFASLAMARRATALSEEIYGYAT